MKLTVIVPTYNRDRLLSRLLRYYRSCEAPFPLLLLDSSSEPESAEVRSLVQSLGATHVRYDPATPPTAKLADGVRRVSTPYVVLWADDDLLVPGACGAAAQWLEEHPDASSAYGDAGLFQVQRHGSRLVADIGPYRQRSYTEPTAAGRVRHYLREATVIFYAVQRTTELAEHLERCLASGLANPIHRSDWWVERILAALSLVHGKAQRLQRLYMMRERHPGADSWEADRLDIFEWVTSDSFSGAYHAFSVCLGEAIAGQDGLSRDEAQAAIKEAFWSHVCHGLAKSWQARYGRRQITSASRWRQAAANLPAVRSAWRAARSRLPGHALSVESLCRPSSPYHDDFMPMYHAMTGHNGHEVARDDHALCADL